MSPVTVTGKGLDGYFWSAYPEGVIGFKPRGERAHQRDGEGGPARSPHLPAPDRTQVGTVSTRVRARPDCSPVGP